MLGIFLISFTTATCQSNNDFEQTENFNICSGRCRYEINEGNYVDCNSSIECYLSMTYPNGSIISYSQEMTFNDSNLNAEIFNYSLGNTSDFPTGIYQGQINCYGTNGFSDPINFEASVSSIEVSYISGRGNPISDYPVLIKEEIKKTLKDWFLYRKWYFVVGLFLFVLAISVFYDYKKHKFKKLVKAVRKELKFKK